jgi:hypothetical protein
VKGKQQVMIIHSLIPRNLNFRKQHAVESKVHKLQSFFFFLPNQNSKIKGVSNNSKIGYVPPTKTGKYLP